jgi:predicted Rossmann fold flavoprotein
LLKNKVIQTIRIPTIMKMNILPNSDICETSFMCANLTKQSNFDAIIIGAGACGLMCAVQAGFLGKRTLVLEKNNRAGAKILISGGGRCNYTNLHTTAQQFISANPHFCKSAFAQWTVDDTVNFFETYGITGQEKTLGQLFPTTNKAKDVVEVFTNLCKDLDQPIWLNTEVEKVEQTDNGFQVSFERDGIISDLIVPSVVVATGGLPVQKLGATDFGLRIARQFGMNIIKPMPALVPLTIRK